MKGTIEITDWENSQIIWPITSAAKLSKTYKEASNIVPLTQTFSNQNKRINN